jgi:hypothetical protein
MCKYIITFFVLSFIGAGCMISVPSNISASNSTLSDKYDEIDRDFKAKEFDPKERIDKKVEAYEAFCRNLRIDIE